MTLYTEILVHIFSEKWKKGMKSVPFARADLIHAAKALDVEVPKNLGDVIYSLRYRTAMPEKITRTQPEGLEWVIVGKERALYAFELVPLNRIVPDASITAIDVPDSTPGIIRSYGENDEQALLAVVRYNRLIDIFLGVTAYSLQNHLRSTVRGIGQIEIDELYVGIDVNGMHHVIPVQAKGGSDQISVVQTNQDIEWCRSRFPALRCRAVSVQFIEPSLIAMFELEQEEVNVRLVQERRYKLV
jgi:hypothetical protein